MLTRHRRFIVALALGMAVYGAGHLMALHPAARALFGFDALSAAYLAMMLRHAQRTGPDDLRRHAETEDEGIALILTLAVAAVGVSLGALWLVLTGAAPGSSLPGAALGLVAVPLGWGMIHTLAAFRYAHLHYAPGEEGRLAFPGDGDRSGDPGPWDFLYFSFTIGMTAQTSDVAVLTPRMRRVVLVHAVGAFFYNTVILALAVNAGLALAK